MVLLFLTWLFVSPGPRTFSTRTRWTGNLNMRNPPCPSNTSLTRQVRGTQRSFCFLQKWCQMSWIPASICEGHTIYHQIFKRLFNCGSCFSLKAQIFLSSFYTVTARTRSPCSETTCWGGCPGYWADINPSCPFVHPGGLEAPSWRASTNYPLRRWNRNGRLRQWVTKLPRSSQEQHPGWSFSSFGRWCPSMSV